MNVKNVLTVQSASVQSIFLIIVNTIAKFPLFRQTYSRRYCAIHQLNKKMNEDFLDALTIADEWRSRKRRFDALRRRNHRGYIPSPNGDYEDSLDQDLNVYLVEQSISPSLDGADQVLPLVSETGSSSAVQESDEMDEFIFIDDEGTLDQDQLDQLSDDGDENANDRSKITDQRIHTSTNVSMMQFTRVFSISPAELIRANTTPSNYEVDIILSNRKCPRCENTDRTRQSFVYDIDIQTVLSSTLRRLSPIIEDHRNCNRTLDNRSVTSDIPFGRLYQRMKRRFPDQKLINLIFHVDGIVFETEGISCLHVFLLSVELSSTHRYRRHNMSVLSIFVKYQDPNLRTWLCVCPQRLRLLKCIGIHCHTLLQVSF